MKSKDDMRNGSSPGSNPFLIVLGNPDKVCCLRCKEWCQEIALPDFTMYFCDSIYCTNILELRHMGDGSWKLHDYGAAVQTLLTESHVEQLLVKPRRKTPLHVVK